MLYSKDGLRRFFVTHLKLHYTVSAFGLTMYLHMKIAKMCLRLTGYPEVRISKPLLFNNIGI